MKVQEALKRQFRFELADENGAFSAEKRAANLRILFSEILIGIGAERFMETPVEALDQFAVMTVVKNHDTRGLLVSLCNSFILSYLTPETSERAFKCFEELESLRKEVSESRRKLQ